jgi:hypothetical protein
MQPTVMEIPVLDPTEPVETQDEISRSGDKDAATSLFSADVVI